MFDSQSWGVEVTSATVAVAATTLITVPALSIVRLLAVSAILDAGVAPECNLRVLQTAIGANVAVVCGETITLPAADRIAIPNECPIFGPDHIIQGVHQNGDAATIVTWTAYFVIAPIGTVFYI